MMIATNTYWMTDDLDVDRDQVTKKSSLLLTLDFSANKALVTSDGTNEVSKQRIVSL